MTQTAIRRRKVEMPSGIRKKFTAALSMLLVAAILMVGSTYAWFTLSTAPEVKGITTSIGANGNLEIALLNATSYASDDPDLGIRSDVGDAIGSTYKANWTVDKANHTWGNLVDLSDTTYGLKNITLLPAALNITNPTAAAGTAHTIGTSILKVPEYGGDGRVIAVTESTSTGRHVGAGSFIAESAYAGVRVIGVASKTSLRVSEYVLALGQAQTYQGEAVRLANVSLLSSGSDLGSLIIDLTNGGTSYSREQYESLNTVLSSISNANNQVLEAIKQSAIAYYLSSENNTEIDETGIGNIKTAVAGITPANASATSFSSLSVTGVTLPALPQSINDAMAHYLATAGKISTAQGKYTANTTGTNAGKTTYTKDELSEVLDDIIDRSNTKVANIQNPGLSNMGAIVTAAQPIPIVMGIGENAAHSSGVYEDIAKAAGDLSVGPVDVPVSYSGTSFDLPVTMSTDAGSPILLNTVASGISNKAYGTGSGQDASGASSISPYGYALDFGVRTNADGAKLLLQSDSAQRVYSDSDNADTKGEGSFIEFTSYDISKFSVVKMRKLIGAIRVAFVTPGENGYELLAIAVPDVEKVVVDNEDTYPGIKESKSSAEEGAAVDTLTVKLAMYNCSFDPVVNEAPKFVLGAKKTGNDAFKITDLTKNQAKKITVIVYLDGDEVDNTMVANAASSMSGKLNLQFTTDKALVPMENAALRNGNASPSDRAKARFAQLVKNEFSPAQLLIINQQVNNGATDWRDKVVAAGAIVAAAGNDDISDDNVTVLNGYLNTIANSAADIATWKTQNPGT